MSREQTYQREADDRYARADRTEARIAPVVQQVVDETTAADWEHEDGKRDYAAGALRRLAQEAWLTQEEDSEAWTAICSGLRI